MKLITKLLVLITLFATMSLATVVQPVVARPAIPQIRNNPNEPAMQWYTYALYLEKVVQSNGANVVPTPVPVIPSVTTDSATLATILTKVTTIETYVNTYRVLINLPFRSLVINWADNSNNETGFLIETSIDGKNFVKVGTVGPNVTTYTDANLGPGTYWYRVSAMSAAGVTVPTNIVSATLH